MPMSGVSPPDRVGHVLLRAGDTFFTGLKCSRTPHKILMPESCSLFQTHNLSAVCVPVYAALTV